MEHMLRSVPSNPSSYRGRESERERTRERGLEESTSRRPRVQGLLANKDTHRPWGGPMLLGIALR